MPRLWVTVFLVVLLQWNHTSRGYYELVEELGCQDTEFRLICGRLDGRIAILEATFSRNESTFSPLGASCGRIAPKKATYRGFRQSETAEINVRHAVNKSHVYGIPTLHPSADDLPNSTTCTDCTQPTYEGCSGVNYCSFILEDDYPPATEWGSGTVYLRYVCLDDVHITRTCSAVLDIDLEGFVQSPGYPRYYIGGRNCQWMLRARPSQSVRIKFLDVSLRGVAPFESHCLDRLVVSEGGFDMLSTCGDSTGDVEVLSVGPVLNVSLTTNSKLLYPKRGILFHYKAIGCLTPRTPQNGTVVFKNESLVRYRCCPGYVFPDTLSPDRTLHCYNENSWNTDVPDCTSEESMRIFPEILESHNKGSDMDEQSNVKDVVIPSIVMTVLFIGNALLLLLILHYRRKLDTSHFRRKSIEMEETKLGA